MEGRGVKKIGEIIEKNNMWVISDEIHCDLLRLDQKHIPLGKVMPDYKKLVTCMAPSKTFNLAGLMISNVMIRDEGLKNIWLSKHYNFDNPLSIAAARPHTRAEMHGFRSYVLILMETLNLRRNT